MGLSVRRARRVIGDMPGPKAGPLHLHCYIRTSCHGAFVLPLGPLVSCQLCTITHKGIRGIGLTKPIAGIAYLAWLEHKCWEPLYRVLRVSRGLGRGTGLNVHIV